MLFYRWLLRLFPSSFRNEYGREMVAVFARQRRDARGPFAVAALWMRAIADTCVGSAAVHRDIAAQDLRYTVRTLARAPGFMMTALLVIGLGVGATTAAFSVTDYVLLRPLPFPESQRLVKVWEQRPGFTRMELAPANYRDWKRMAQSFESFAAYRGLSVNLVGGSQPMRIQGAVWTAEMLDTLGVQPLIGRGFTPADDRDGAPGTVLLSHGLWQREFGGAESVAGRTIRLDDQVYTIIGVMPHGFHFPTRDAELWAPMRFAPAEFEDRNDNYLNAIARLRPGVSLDAARAEMDLLAARLTAQYPKENEHTKTLVIGLRDELSAQSRMMLVAVLGAAGCLLLIACANLANLLLARAIVRRREVAIRLALGAGHERLLRQLLTESLVLTGLGGALGVALAAVMLPLLSRLVPASLPVAAAPAIDWRVLAFAATVTIATGLVFGVLPLIHSRPARAGDGLREGARAGGGQRERLRGALVVAEITASVVLLVLCGLLLRALWRIQATDPGFTTDSALAVRTSLPMPKYETVAARTAFYSRVLSDVRAIPGVSHAGYISFLPMGDMRGGIFPVGVNGVVEDRRQNQVASLRYVTPGFFDALRIPLHRGRDVSESDTSDRQYVAVVSETFASQFFPGQDPIGRRFNFARADREIVGVVGDVKVRGLARVSEPQVYVPHQQVADALFVWYSPKDLVVRTAGNPLALVNAVRGVVRAADPDQPISDVQTLDDLVGHETVARVAQLRVLGAFAVIAVLLGAIGIHGLLAFAVSARTAEIGVRMALGARRMDIIELVVARSLMLATAGIASGVVLAYWSGRAAQSLLAGVEPGDAATFAVAVGVTVAMTIAGSVRPALRAARIDPVTVMRIE